MNRIIFFFLLLTTCQLFSDEPQARIIEDIEDYSTLIDFQGMPSSVVEGCVNVITGNYFESEEDVSAAGPNAISVTRYTERDSTIGF